jgi:sporulation protein YlmC with PRC-barrel domain/ribosomal protein L40E
MYFITMSIEDNYIEKKLRGSGGYTIAKINDKEQKMANLGGPELFLAGIGRLDSKRFIKYYCNKCEKNYEGAPAIEYENPNEDLGENIILIEKGEYKCNVCNYTIAQYRKFNELKEEEKTKEDIPPNDNLKEKNDTNVKLSKESETDNQETRMLSKDERSTRIGDKEIGFSPIEKLLGMYTYDNNAQLVGRINEIGLRKSPNGKAQFSFKIINKMKDIIEVLWDDIDKIGDIIILHEKNFNQNTKYSKNTNDKINNVIDNNKDSKICKNCNYKNDIEAIFCEECGKKL